MMEELTVVVFRKWRDTKAAGNGVIALFPCQSIGARPFCESFEHIGQRGAADYDMVMKRTRPATPAEYEPLKRELESAPYDYRLTVRARRPGKPRRRMEPESPLGHLTRNLRGDIVDSRQGGG
jgi:hypothetical protein